MILQTRKCNERLVRELNLDDKNSKPSTIADKISRKDDLKQPLDMVADAENSATFSVQQLQISKLYQQNLKGHKPGFPRDFIMKTVMALEENTALLTLSKTIPIYTC